MSVLKAAARNSLPATAFGLPKKRKFPMPDKSHARNALARASEGVHNGTLSSSEAAEIRAKADKKLGK